MRISEADDTDLIAGSPLLAYLAPGGSPGSRRPTHFRSTRTSGFDRASRRNARLAARAPGRDDRPAGRARRSRVAVARSDRPGAGTRHAEQPARGARLRGRAGHRSGRLRSPLCRTRRAGRPPGPAPARPLRHGLAGRDDRDHAGRAARRQAPRARRLRHEGWSRPDDLRASIKPRAGYRAAMQAGGAAQLRRRDRQPGLEGSGREAGGPGRARLRHGTVVRPGRRAEDRPQGSRPLPAQSVRGGQSRGTRSAGRSQCDPRGLPPGREVVRAERPRARNHRQRRHDRRRHATEHRRPRSQRRDRGAGHDGRGRDHHRHGDSRPRADCRARIAQGGRRHHPATARVDTTQPRRSGSQPRRPLPHSASNSTKRRWAGPPTATSPVSSPRLSTGLAQLATGLTPTTST